MSPTDTFITIGGLRMHLRDWGGPDAPPAILLVHGLASNARIWDLLELVARLTHATDATTRRYD